MGRKALTDVRKPVILKNYYKVIIEDGYDKASIPNVAKRMKVYPNLITHYFKSKEQLEISLVDHMLNEYINAFKTILDEESKRTNVQTQIYKTLFSEKWNSIFDNSVFFAMFYQIFRKPRIKKEFQKVFKEFKTVLSDLMERHDIEDTESKAVLLIMLVEGYDLFQELNIKYDGKKFSETLIKVLQYLIK